MADGQISFYSTTDVDSLNVPEGAVIISKRDEEKHLADLFAMLGGDRYQVKPSYDWDEIENTPNIEEYVNQWANAAGLKLLLKYFWIDYISAEDSTDGEVELKIYANEGDDSPVSSEGNFVTASELNDGIENGTFLVGNRAVSIGGLRSAAYTESEDYSPMTVSTWTDL